MFERACNRRQPLRHILRDVVPQEIIPRTPSGPRAQGMTAAAVKNFRWIYIIVHLRPCADPIFVRQVRYGKVKPHFPLDVELGAARTLPLLRRYYRSGRAVLRFLLAKAGISGAALVSGMRNPL